MDDTTQQEMKMDDDEFEGVVRDLVRSAESFVDEELTPWRTTVSDYYHGRPFGNEMPGRSQVVVTEVRDTVNAVIPQIMRQYFSAEHAVQFESNSPAGDEHARQATDFILQSLKQDNEWFLLMHSVLKDGLKYRAGVAKYWWEPPARKPFRVENATEEQIQHLMLTDESVEVTRAEPTGEEPAGPNGEPPMALYTVEYTKVDGEGKLRVLEVPPEEFVYTRDVRRMADGRGIIHRMNKTRGELMMLGISPEILDEFGGGAQALDDNMAVRARSLTNSEVYRPFNDTDEANELIAYVEAYVRIDYDGDGVAELRKVCAIGETYHVISNEPKNRIPFAVFRPDPEPHTFESGSLSDRTMDLQRIKSSVLRAQLDSLAAAIHPRLGYVEGQVSPADVMNHVIGAPLRMRAPGMVQPIVIPFLGAEATPVLAYLDEMGERRTGQRMGAVGLDSDALQSSTQSAVSAALSTSQMQTELLAMMFAWTFLRPLMKGLLQEFVEHQPRVRVAKLRGKWTEIDPTTWDGDMDVSVNLSLGAGFVEDRLGVLEAIAAKQENIIAQMGPTNPICGLKELRNTYALAAELRGFHDATRFFKEITPEIEQQLAQPAPPTPTPEQVLAEAQAKSDALKAEQALVLKQAEIQLEREKMERDDAFRREQLATNRALKEYELTLQYSKPNATAQLNAEVQQHKAHANAEVQKYQIDTNAAVQEKASDQRHVVDAQKTDDQYELEHRKADIADRQVDATIEAANAEPETTE